MKQPFRVAVVGRSEHRVEVLLAGMSASVHPRAFPDWAALEACEASFSPELVVTLPGCTSAPGVSRVPFLPLAPEDLHSSPAALEAHILGQTGSLIPEPQWRLLGHS